MSDGTQPRGRRRRLSRRAFVTVAGAAAATTIGGKLLWDRSEGLWRSQVFVGAAADYSADLVSVIRSGLLEIGLSAGSFRGKTVLLKPNLIEPADQSRPVVTHPAVVQAVAEVFSEWQAGDILIAEGPGHCRDARLSVESAGLSQVLDDMHLPYVDLNHDDVVPMPNATGLTGIPELYLPARLVHADYVVSVAKLKTHHWSGVTLSMKNLFGVMPGICYGWPKNVFHEVGITPSILDINAAVAPDLAIIDGIVGMEGDGPLMGAARTAGVLVIGTNPTAVDATATRIMGADPYQIAHLAAASGRLGPISEAHIEQRGESIARFTTRFRMPEEVLSGPAQGAFGS